MSEAFRRLRMRVNEEVPSGAEGMRRARSVAGQVALTYLVVSSVWILGSGYLVELLPLPLHGRAEVLKGFLFVVVTAALLWVIILRWVQRYAAQSDIATGAERRVRQVMETVPVGVVLTDGEGRIDFLNPAAEQMLGTRGPDAVGKPLTEVARPLDSNVKSVEQLMLAGRADGLEVRGSDAEATRALISRGARFDPQSDGEEQWVIALTDVTDSHHEGERNRRLIDGHRFLSRALHLVDTAHDRQQLFDSVCTAAVSDGVFAGAWIAAPDAATGRLRTFAHQGLPQRSLRRVEEILASTSEPPLEQVAKLLQNNEVYVINDLPDDAASPIRDIAVEEGFGSSMTFDVVSDDAPIAVLTLFSAQSGFFDQEQIRLVETLREGMAFALEKLDLDAKRLEAEESVVRSEAAYRGIFEAHPEPMWVFDRATLRFLAVNEAAIRKYGYSREEFESMTVLDIRPAEDMARLLESVAHQRPDSQESGYWTHIDKCGRAFTAHVGSSLVNWSGIDAQLVLAQEIATMD